MPDPQVGERWKTAGLFPDEPHAFVTITEADPEAVCVDVTYDDGTERLLPRQCMIERVAEAPTEED
jgi:hypothetical protein